MQMNNSGGDVDRALNSIRARAEQIRQTIARLESNLAWNPTITWPELLNQYFVIAKQLEHISEEIPDMTQHFACVPRMSTPNPADIPLLLRTREVPEMEDETQKNIKAYEENSIPSIENMSIDTLQRLKTTHNDNIEAMEEAFNGMSDTLLKSIRGNKLVVKTKPDSSQSSQFKFIESGSYE